MDNFEKCLHACRDALIIEPNNLKALYRASVSLRLLNQLEQAEKYLMKALAIDSQNREILIEVGRLKEALDLALQAMNKKPDNFKESFVENSKENQFVYCLSLELISTMFFRVLQSAMNFV